MSYYTQKLRYYKSVIVEPSFLYTDTSLWLKGDNALNTNLRWYDASPNDHILTGSATLTDNVLNGQKGYVFNGTSNYFDGGNILNIGSGSRTMIAVAKKLNTNSSIYAKSLYGGTTNRYAIIIDSNILYDICSPQISPGIYYSNTSVLFNKYTTILNRLSLIHSTYLNDILKGTQVITDSDMVSNYKFLVGAYNNNNGTTPPMPGFYLNGVICEIIFFDRLLTTDENTAINDYLILKYGTL